MLTIAKIVVAIVISIFSAPQTPEEYVVGRYYDDVVDVGTFYEDPTYEGSPIIESVGLLP